MSDSRWISVAEARDPSYIGQSIEVRGWVRTRRDSKAGLSFVEVNDGSCLGNLQVIAPESLPEYEPVVRHLSAGCSVVARGELKPSQGEGQSTELLADQIRLIGEADPATYPLQKKRHSFEKLREWAHLRPRTNAIGAVMRVRNRLSYSTHQFFQNRGFFYIQTPIITASDCEGAGQLFRVTAGSGHDQPPATAAGQPPGQAGASADHAEFFGRPTYLTVSGQLEAEIMALALGKVYTFGPTFRAENSNTSRHLAEFWMIEPEMAFYELADNMELAQDYLQHLVRDVLQHCHEDLELFNERIAPGLIHRLEQLQDAAFERISYTDAIKILERSEQDFEFPVRWGVDLQSEHERFLTEVHVGGPVILYDYPASIKPFYMRLSDDGQTVRAMDVLVPHVGEIIGGSQREERLDVLSRRMLESGLPTEPYWWYLELRKFGSVPHSGFGLGLERMVQFVTGMANIRDVIPFPRTPGSAEF